ncbi:hypothetical protein [Chroococcus sp. FPU101]|uniref:hypothetical protein n=1 Tax=Chroococcus sp. FPU101 TaxID=1974212 RepID=UPI001A904DDE|nr:hypothetical protein [Chroococcus sp. FPU101]GFE68701.1 hypothetical protein CFPU101_13110 [Chroococcus sp. FPU101]
MTVQRWTDEMLNDLAVSVIELRESVNTLRDSVLNTRKGLDTVGDSVDGLRITAQALLQVAAQHQRDMELHKQEMELFKQRQAKSDQRFNILLKEVRYLRRASQGDDSIP